MSHLINKLLGREEETQSHSGVEIKTEAGGAVGSSQRSGSTSGQQTQEGRSVQRDGVNIKSTVSSDVSSTVSMANQQKLNDLVARLGTTHNQVDEYSKKQASKINDEIQKEINEVLGRTRRQQDELLHKANEKTAQIDTEYRARLQLMVEEIDAAKAKQIAEIEKDLNNQQTGILESARAEIDRLNQKAANLKIGAIQQAQAQAAEQASLITSTANLGQAATAHHASGTTTIKTEVTAGASTNVGGSSSSTATTGGAQYSSSSSSKTVETNRNQ